MMGVVMVSATEGRGIATCTGGSAPVLEELRTCSAATEPRGSAGRLLATRREGETAAPSDASTAEGIGVGAKRNSLKAPGEWGEGG